MDARVWLILAFCAYARATQTAKGYYCKDPDTGNLYSVNTTWPSTTFCGNYTCKIKMKVKDTEKAPSKIIINVTSSEPIKHEEDAKAAESSNIFVKQDGTTNRPIDDVLNLNRDSGEDRYLTPDEVSKISELLHSIKKSDLEAIIEIFNLAQEVYKEIDEETLNIAREGSIHNAAESNQNNYAEFKSVQSGPTSYWYEPLHGFHKLIDIKPVKADESVNKKVDMKAAASDYITISAGPYETHTYTQVPQATYPTTQAAYYSTGPVLNSQDQNRISYYYPLSNFQRIASYYRQHPQYETPNYRAPCNPCLRQQYPMVYTDRRPHSVPQAYTPVPAQKPALPSMLLPFPFTYHPYNGSAYNHNSNYNNYYRGIPWTFKDLYKTQPYPLLPKEKAESKVVLSNPYNTPVQDEAQKPVENNENVAAVDNNNKKKDESQPWHTDPLSENVIAEIRANIAERAKLLRIPLKKRIKLERVAKVIKLDHLNRQKREAIDVEQPAPETSTSEPDGEPEFYVYIEKTTCESSTELGFFRVGNMSQPFPACCPQKIETS